IRSRRPRYAAEPLACREPDSMKRTTKRSLPALALLAALLFSGLLGTRAQAALGGSVDSVAADSSALRGQLRSTGFVDYDMHQISSGELVVNEYANRAGQVFAITWHGPLPPNLQQLLGTYFARLRRHRLSARARAQRRLHRPAAVVLVISRVFLMKQVHRLFGLLGLVVTLALGGCGGGGNSASSAPTQNSFAGGGNNVVAMTVEPGPASSGNQPFNQPYVSVKFCVPGGSCATISGILVDSGSYGLRVMASVLEQAGVDLPAMPDPVVPGNTIQECLPFADGYAWGKVSS